MPIGPPERIAETRPDAIVILPWSLAKEIAAQLAYTNDWGASLIVPTSDRDHPRTSPDRQLTVGRRWP
jgi:C-methyltransferase C-terminal domain